MAGATEAGLMVMEKFCEATGLTPFVAVIVPVNKPLAVGVPDSTPEVLKLSPVGRLPEVTLKVGVG